MSYLLSDAAQEDLTEIWDRIAIDSETAADRYLRRIRAECEALVGAPLAGSVRPEFTNKPVRFWLVGPYNKHFIVYDPLAQPIEIMRILHGARDLPNVVL